MPILPELPKADVKKFFMPSDAQLPEEQQGWVEMDISPLSVQDLLSVESTETADENISMTKRGLSVFAERVKDWNYTEADGATKVPITVESIIRIGAQNLGYLAQQLPTADTGLQLTVTQKKS